MSRWKGTEKVSLPNNEALLTDPPLSSRQNVCNHRIEFCTDIRGTHSVNATDLDDPVDVKVASDIFFIEGITSSNRHCRKICYRHYCPHPQGNF